VRENARGINKVLLTPCHSYVNVHARIRVAGIYDDDQIISPRARSNFRLAALIGARALARRPTVSHYRFESRATCKCKRDPRREIGISLSAVSGRRAIAVNKKKRGINGEPESIRVSFEI